MTHHLPTRNAPAGRTSWLSRAGFSLLEIMMALAVFVIIASGVFAIAQGTMELSADMTTAQERSMIRQNFIEFLRSSFRRIPPEAEMVLEVTSDGGAYVPTISIYNGGDAMSPGAAISPEGSVELFARQIPGGFLRIGLRMLDGEQTNARRLSGARRAARSGQEMVLPLIEKAGRFEWKFLDGATGRWENAWKGPGRPVMAECLFALDDGVETRSVFWIPPLVKSGTGGAPQPGQPQLGPDGQPLPPTDPNAVPPPNPNVTPPPAPPP